MVDCGPPWVGLFMATTLLVLPLGVPLLAAAAVAWRKAVPWAVRGAFGIALVGAVAWTVAVLDHPADPRWIPLLFAPALVASGVALARPSRGARLALLVAAIVPVVGGLAFGIVLRLAWRPCF